VLLLPQMLHCCCQPCPGRLQCQQHLRFGHIMCYRQQRPIAAEQCSEHLTAADQTKGGGLLLCMTQPQLLLLLLLSQHAA
jgi:hypothetical protein